MINDVRNTVLAILNKDNRGYLTPEQFNLYADNAQKEIFEQYFHDYSRAINKRNKHLHTSGYGDIPKRLAEVIDRFTFPSSLTYNGTTLKYTLPTDAYSFGTVSYVGGANNVEIEPVEHNKILYLDMSLDTAPTELYPVYTRYDGEIQVYPNTIATTGDVLMTYVRYPATPKWTYSGFANGEPLFNQSATDYQDFEVPEDDKINLVEKILQYAGVALREVEVVKAAKADEIQEKQEQQ
jgi:hypothetical protein